MLRRNSVDAAKSAGDMLSPQHLYITAGQKTAVLVGLQPMVEVNLVEVRTHEFFP